MGKMLKILISVGQLDETRTRINPIGMRIARKIPILIDFDEKNNVGYCDCKIEDDKIYAYLPITENFYNKIFLDRTNDFWNMFPQMGIAVIRHIHHKDHLEIVDFDMLEVSLCSLEGPEPGIVNLRQQFDLKQSILIS